MVRIIDGKRYNTDTAEQIAHFHNGYSSRDFQNLSESLYKSPAGTYFLAGKGGPMTRYARPCGDMTTGGEGITVLTHQEALAWCEQHDVDADTIAAHFSIVDG